MTMRLAPSPTGAQHLGNARTSLITFWGARQSNQELVLRIEDIDSPRVKPWATAQAIEDLRWLGISWDQGPDVGGPHAPYIQTERRELYGTALKRLIAGHRVYPCTCTRRDIETAASAPHVGEEGPRYPGTCRDWKLGDSLPDEGTYCWRFRASSRKFRFMDRVAGTHESVPFESLGDFPVTRKTGEAAYQLAVVVDDALMHVDDVVRGYDLLPSTFRQLDLFEALGWTPPRYSHVALVVGQDGLRLAKRHGDTRMSHFRDLGVDPRLIVRWGACSSGIELPTTAGAWSLETLQDYCIEQFAWERLSVQSIVTPTSF